MKRRSQRKVRQSAAPARQVWLKYSHQWLDACDLAMARRIAKKIRANPMLMRIPRRNLARWKTFTRPWPAAFREWERILAKNSTERVLEILTQDTGEGQRLRQSDPFVGILRERERRWFLEQYEPETTGGGVTGGRQDRPGD